MTDTDCPFCGGKNYFIGDEGEKVACHFCGDTKNPDAERIDIKNEMKNLEWSIVECQERPSRRKGDMHNEVKMSLAQAKMLRAALAQSQPNYSGIPKGWKLVPVEPTEEMLDRGVAFALQATVHGEKGWTNYVRSLFQTMIAAAPQPPASQGDLQKFCPECGNSAFNSGVDKERQCTKCKQSWFPDVDYSRAIASNLQRLIANQKKEKP